MVAWGRTPSRRELRGTVKGTNVQRVASRYLRLFAKNGRLSSSVLRTNGEGKCSRSPHRQCQRVVGKPAAGESQERAEIAEARCGDQSGGIWRRSYQGHRRSEQ